MRVLILGGAGLLGTHLAPFLKKAGHEVVLADNFSGGRDFILSPDYRVYTVDTESLNSVQHVFNAFRPEIVFLAVGYSYARDIIYSSYFDVKLVQNSANVVSSLLPGSVNHFYFCSGYEVYGGPQTSKPLKETRKINISASLHGTAELMAEKIIQYRCAKASVPCTILRIFDMYGPRARFSPRTGVLSFIIDALIREELIGLVGAKKERDFIHVEDVASAIMVILKVKYEGIVNVGTGKGTTLKEIVQELVSAMETTNQPLLVSSNDVDIFSSVADISVLSSFFKKGWNPKHSVIKDLSALVKFRKENFSENYRAEYLSPFSFVSGK